MNAPASSYRRGACPGLSAPMPTGDGLLMRLLPIGTIPLSAFGKLCALARTHGNGIVEVTARGSIQVRGLSAATAPRFADAIAALNIAAADGIPVLSAPLAGLDPDEILDSATLAAALRRALTNETLLAARLAPKVSVAIDGGGALNLNAIAAHVRMRAVLIDGAAMLCASAGADAMSTHELGVVTSSNGVAAALRLLEVIAKHGSAARARDLLGIELGALLRRAIADLIVGGPPPASEPSRDTIGMHRLRDGSLACGIGVAFGYADAVTLQEFTDVAGGAGAAGIRTAPGRTLMIIGLAGKTAPQFVAAAERLGFIVRGGDPRRFVFACTGAPSCTSAHIAARTAAPLVANAAAPFLDDAFTIHISGCVKGCAHPGPAALVAVGTVAGCALVANGSAQGNPFAVIHTHELPVWAAHYARSAKRKAGHV